MALSDCYTVKWLVSLEWYIVMSSLWMALDIYGIYRQVIK